MNEASFLALLHNAALLLSMALLYDIATARRRIAATRIQQGFLGIVLGLIGIAVMMTPWTFESGLIFDTRSVLLGISGLFFGTIPTVIAVIITAGFRLYQGGSVVTGVSVILASGAIGIVWRHLRRQPLSDISWLELCGLGLAIHLVMLALMFTLPAEKALHVLRVIGLPVLLIYPLGTAILGSLMVNRLRRERIATALQESEQNFRAIADYTSDWETWNDPDGKLLWVNPSVERLTGYTVGECLANPDFPWSLIHPEDRPAARQRFCPPAGAAGERDVQEFRFIRKDGAVRWGEKVSQPIYDADGHPLGHRVSIRDITERRQGQDRMQAAAEETRRLFAEAEQSRRALLSVVEDQKRAEGELLHERNLLHALMANIPDRVYFKDTQSRFTRISRAHAESMGLEDPAAAQGKTDADFKPAEFARQTLAEEQNIIRTGKPLIAKLEKTFRSDGQPVWTSASKAPIRDAGGQVVGLVGISRDITADIELQQQMQQSQKMEAIGQLAGGIAHDFNNLLLAIQGFSDILLNDMPEQDSHRQDVLEIRTATRRAANLTRQLLAFSRKQIIEPKVLDLNGVVTNMEKMLLRLLGEDIHLTTELDPALKRVKADPGQIEQIVMNLSVNARDAMPQGGQLTIQTSNIVVGEQDMAIIPESLPGEFICLSVADSGLGMTKQVLSHIFEPFFSTKGIDKGTGLGLAVIYGIVKQNHGWINVYSQLGQGSVFKIYLPAHFSAEKDPVASAKEKPLDVQGHGERILLVEDEFSVRHIATRVLQAGGYVVLAAESLQQARDVFAREKGRFDLVFSDVVLPDGNGIDLVQELITQSAPTLSVLLSSGYSDERSRWNNIEKKGFRFLSKPYPTAKLLQTVRSILNSRGS